MAGERKYAKLGAKLTDLNEALEDRFKDAEVLIAGGCYASAIAMGLYALEIALKIAICRRLDLEALPVEFQIHDFEGLLILSGLSRRLEAPERAAVRKHWFFLIGKYKSSQAGTLRYSRGTFTSRQARDVIRRLRDPNEGLVTWLSGES
jgi:hypothetical protein